jgi:4-hydroxy-3-polyprenylbenzoate decarboxylase
MQSRVVVAIGGSSNLLYGVRALELLQDVDHETHLIVSDDAHRVLSDEGRLESVQGLADEVHNNDNIGAPPASGSFETAGMLVAPCSSATAADIAHGSSGTLVTRSADVALKERRQLVVMPTELPLNRIHIQNLLKVTEANGVVVPPFPSFYQRPKTVDDIVTRTTARALEFFGVDVDYGEWMGLSGA